MDADVGVFLAVHGDGGRDFDVGMVEVGQFRFPVLLVFEVDEDGAQDAGVVELGIGLRFDVGRRDFGSGLGGIAPLAEAAWSEAAGTEAARSFAFAAGSEVALAAGAILFDDLAGCGALVSIQPAVAILVELRRQLAALAHHRASETSGTQAHPIYRDSNGKDRKSTRLNSSHIQKSRMPSSA